MILSSPCASLSLLLFWIRHVRSDTSKDNDSAFKHQQKDKNYSGRGSKHQDGATPRLKRSPSKALEQHGELLDDARPTTSSWDTD